MKQEKIPCPHCGRAINKRKIVLIREMVRSLRSVYVWCGENKRHEFSRADVKHLFHSENETAHFGDWVYFGGILYRAEKGRGHWGMNMKRAKAFLKGEWAINTVAMKDPITKAVELSDKRFIHEVKGLVDLLTPDFKFIPEYGELCEQFTQDEYVQG